MSSVTFIVVSDGSLLAALSRSPFLINIKLPFWQTLPSRISISYLTFYVA
jgi:hypothetical protein